MVFKLGSMSVSLGGLVKTQIAGPISSVSDSVSMGWGLRICISGIFSSVIDGTGAGHSLRNVSLN